MQSVSPLAYFDSASMVPPCVEALDAMTRAASTVWGHPGALHVVGGRALHALDVARAQVADYLDVPAHEIVFTTSARDAMRLALTLVEARGGRITSSRQEHPAIQASVTARGRDVDWLALPGGVASDADLERARSAELIVLSACNHELGTTAWPVLQAVASDASRIVDAVQLAPWCALSELNDDRTFYAISGAKLGAPLGIAALRVPSPVYYAERTRSALEAPSLPWLLAISLGAACEARAARRAAFLEQAKSTAESLMAAIQLVEPNVRRNGASGALLGPIVDVSFPGRLARSLVAALSLEGVCVAHTASCRSRAEEMSPVVRAAYPEDLARAESAVRWSVSERTTAQDVENAIAALARIFAADPPLP